MIRQVQQIGLVVSQNNWTILATGKFEILAKNPFFFHLLTLFFPIYSFYFFFIPLKYNSNDFIFLFYLSWGSQKEFRSG